MFCLLTIAQIISESLVSAKPQEMLLEQATYYEEPPIFNEEALVKNYTQNDTTRSLTEEESEL